MVAVGAGLLWLGWNGFNGGDPYYAGADAAAAVLNTNLGHRRRVPRLGRLGLRHRPQAVADRQRQRHDRRPRRDHAGRRLRERLGRNRDRRDRLVGRLLRATTTWRRAGRSGSSTTRSASSTRTASPASPAACSSGVLADSHMILYLGPKGTSDIFVTGECAPAEDAVLRRHVGDRASRRSARSSCSSWSALLIPLRMSDVDMETGDLAVHGHEVYPSDVPVARLSAGLHAPSAGSPPATGLAGSAAG